MRLVARASALFFGLMGSLMAWLAHERSLLPYNEEGRYYDGEVVFHEQAIDTLILLATVAFIIAALSLVVLHRSRGRAA